MTKPPTYIHPRPNTHVEPPSPWVSISQGAVLGIVMYILLILMFA